MSGGVGIPLEWRRGEFVVTTDPARVDLGAVHAYLARSYWAEGIPLEIVSRAVAGSLCFSLWHQPEGVVERSESLAFPSGSAPDPDVSGAGPVGFQPEQIGFARAVTDRATFAYLADVFVLEPWRGRGLSKWLMTRVMAHPDLQGLRRFVLCTRDAHALYARYGFREPERPELYMEIARPGLYLKR